MRRWAAAAWLIGLLQLGSGAAAAQTTPVPYVVGPSDVLGITVFDQPQLSGKFPVQADGNITFPLVGRIKVGGLGVQEIENSMRARLADGFLKNPQVAVSVEQYRSQQIIIIGEVRNPGTLEFTGPMTLMTALARAGSTTEKAAPEALVMRPAEGAAPAVDRAAIERAQQTDASQVTRIDLEALQNGTLTQNITLRGGDTIYVPRGATVFVTGHVNRPGEFSFRKGMTVRQLLGLAGGPTDRGSTGRIQVIRKVGNEDRTIDVKQEDTVQPNDTINVRERFF